MTLSEIKNNTDPLNDKEFEELFESFNSEIDVGWSKHVWGYLGSFALDGKPYSIEMRTTKIPGLKTSNTVEVSFYRSDVDKIEKSFSSTGDIFHGAMKVYGAVFNALLQKYGEFDAFYFAAVKRHSGSDYAKKVDVYTRLAHRIFKKTGCNFYVAESPQETEFLLSKEENSDPKFTPYQKKINEGIDWSKVNSL
jgi:hypothetical protein